jgi:hypothetical protein
MVDIMREQILNLIQTKPKHYTKIISCDPTLLNWVNTNSLSNSEKLSARVYSAIYQISDQCPNGNTKKFDRISTGFTGCGPANVCKCTAENIAKNVSKTKLAVSDEEKQAINDKRVQTMIDRFGVPYNSQREDVKEILSKPKIPLHIHGKLTNYDWMNEEYNVKKRSLTDIANELNIYYSTVAEYCNKFGFTIRVVSPRSTEELQISRYIDELGFKIIESDRTIIAPKELDIVIPDKKLAIEVNGLRWHSHHPSSGIPEKRFGHIQKTEMANAANYKLLHITDYDWNHKRDIVKAMINTHLGLNTRMPARKCEIRNVDKTTEKCFLDMYHIQGYVSSSIAYGLYYNNELLMIFTIGKPRFNKTHNYEVLRMCAKSGITVVGGVSKFVSHIRKELPNSTVLSYCDLSTGTGIGYKNAGFVLESQSDPGYFWTDGNNIISRYKCQKKNLQKWLKTYDSTLSEAQNLFSANYRRYWDCGNKVYVLRT